jgi:ABC-type transport system substrate-binding protein
MTDSKFWTELRGRNVSRRSLLRGAAAGGAGLAGAALIGCGGDDDDADEEETGSQVSTGLEQAAGSGIGNTGAASGGTTLSSGLGILAGDHPWSFESGEPVLGGIFRTHFAGSDAHFSPHHPAGFGFRGGMYMHDQAFDRLFRGDVVNFTTTVGQIERTDPVTYINTLRGTARFQDVEPANGRKVTAADIIANAHVRRDDATAHARNFWAFAVDWEQSGAVDELVYKVVTKTTRNDYFSTTNITYTNKEMVEMHLAGEKTLQEWEVPGGSGTQALTKHVPGSMVETVSHDGWSRNFAGEPYIAGMEFPKITDSAAQEAQFRSGQLSFLDPGQNAIKFATILEDLGGGDRPRVYGVRNFQANPRVMGLNARKEPFNDVRMRKAWHRAMDLDKHIEVMGKGEGTTSGPGPYVFYEQHHVPLDDPQLLDYLKHDPAEAQELIDSAGADGIDVERPLQFVISATDAWQADYAALVKEQVEPLGLRIDVVSIPSAEFTSRVRREESMDWDIFVGGYEARLGRMLRLHHTTSGLTTESVAPEDAELNALIDEWEIIQDEAELAVKSQVIQRKLMELWAPYFITYGAFWRKLYKVTIRNTNPDWFSRWQPQLWIDESYWPG